MTARTIQQGVRAAITRADELSRAAHEQRQEPVAQALDGIRSTLVRIDEAVGGGRIALPLLTDLEKTLYHLAVLVDEIAPDVDDLHDLKETLHDAVQSLSRFEHGLRRQLEQQIAPALAMPSRRPFGVLPLARCVPQDVHSVVDYASAGLNLASSAIARSTKARVTGAALAGTAIVVSAMSDCRLGVVKVVPIEAHEVIDHLWGAASIAMPFVLGYWRREPTVAALQIVAGASTILASLFTDYRSARGVGRSDEEIVAALTHARQA